MKQFVWRAMTVATKMSSMVFAILFGLVLSWSSPTCHNVYIHSWIDACVYVLVSSFRASIYHEDGSVQTETCLKAGQMKYVLKIIARNLI